MRESTTLLKIFRGPYQLTFIFIVETRDVYFLNRVIVRFFAVIATRGTMIKADICWKSFLGL